MQHNRSLLLLSENTDDHLQSMKRSAKRCIWRYHFQAGVWNCRILNPDVDSQLFTSLMYYGFHSWLRYKSSSFRSVLFYVSYSRTTSPFSRLESESGLKLSRNLWTPQNNHVHIYSLWVNQRLVWVTFQFCISVGEFLVCSGLWSVRDTAYMPTARPLSRPTTLFLSFSTELLSLFHSV
jgi:hypothetical protein